MALVKTKDVKSVNKDARKMDRSFESLIVELESNDPLARRWAARDLADFPDASKALLSRLQREQDISVREIIFTTLTCLGNEVAVAGLVECLRSEDVALRNESIEAMKQLPDEVSLIMRNLLSDYNADVRIFAVNILESLRHPEVESWLIDVIEQDDEVNVCATAVDLLGEVGTSSASNALTKLKGRFVNEPYIQFAADLALKRIASE
jgi:HEAT repeat protein